MRADAKVKVAMVLGALLAWPVLRNVADGTIAIETAAVRIAMALALAYAGVALVVRVVTTYLPEPVPEPVAPMLADGVEDAVIVDDGEAAEA